MRLKSKVDLVESNSDVSVIVLFGLISNKSRRLEKCNSPQNRVKSHVLIYSRRDDIRAQSDVL